MKKMLCLLLVMGFIALHISLASATSSLLDDTRNHDYDDRRSGTSLLDNTNKYDYNNNSSSSPSLLDNTNKHNYDDNDHKGSRYGKSEQYINN